MKGQSALTRFLTTDPQDPGCALTTEVLHVFAEAVARDLDDARRRYPGIAAHIEACDPCATDLAGLIAALGDGSSDR